MNTKMPTVIGNQPPSGTLTMFEAKNAESAMRNGMVRLSTALVRHFHRSFATTARRIVVISIVVVTDTPYAAARFVDLRNTSTRPIAANIRIQFTDEM